MSKIKIFILDDARTAVAAIRDAGLSLPLGAHIHMCRPFRWDGEKIVQDFQDAEEAIRLCPIFDLWILDNDLGPGVEGYAFLKLAMDKFPQFLPKSLRSCSANPERRRDIVEHFNNYQKAQAIGGIPEDFVKN